MDIGLYKRARGIKHKAAKPFYPRSPAATPAAPPPPAGSKLAKPAAAAPWVAAPAPPAAAPEVVNAMYSGGGAPGGAGAGDADVDRRAAVYIWRVQERLRRERMIDDWRATDY